MLAGLHAAAWRAAVSALDARHGQRLSILIFHRVLPTPDPLFPGEMFAARFDRLLRLLAGSFEVLPLGRALVLRREGRLPPRALSITFDDGYADNARIALPILQRHGLAATFFVATGFLDGGRMFNDTVIETIRRSSADRIDLSEWGLGARTLQGIGDRRSAIEALLPLVKYRSLEERQDFLLQLIRLAGGPDLPDDLMMRSDEVQALHAAGMEIGGHTVHHPILRLLSDDDAQAEIAQGRQRLQTLIDAPVDVFAYPNGRPNEDYDARHAAMVQRLGFAGAVSTAAGVVTAESDAFQLPRFTPWDHGELRWMGRLMHIRVRGTHHAAA